jgi:glycoside/pentoside/hexuronide:cation symporter, GPH family
VARRRPVTAAGPEHLTRKERPFLDELRPWGVNSIPVVASSTPESAPVPAGSRAGGPLAAPGTPALSARERLAYGVGDFASGLYWQTITVYLTFFYTDVFGLGALAVGTMLGVSRSLDALFDPLMGAIADRTQTRWGKFRPYLLWLCVPLAGAGVLTFTVPDADPSARLVWAWVTFNLLMLLYTSINIPYTAMLAVLTPSPAERTSLASIKFVFAFAAGMFVSAAVLPLARALGAGDAARGWQRCFVLLGGLATLGFLATFIGTRERVQPLRHQTSNLPRDLRDMFSNRPLLILVAYTLLFNVTLSVRSSVSVHYVKYYVGDQPLTLPAFLPGLGGTRALSVEELVAIFNTGGGLSCLCGVLLTPVLSRLLSRKALVIVLYAVVLISTIAVYWIRPDQVSLLFCLGLVTGFAGGPLSPLLWAMYADTVDYAEWKTGRRATGLVFATVLFASKQGWAIGVIVSLGLLSELGFVASSTQTPQSLNGLVLLVSLVPGALGALALALMLFYPLHDRQLTRMGAELGTRRASDDAAAAAL